MAGVTFDAGSVGSESSGTTVTVPHTVASQPDRCLEIDITIDGAMTVSSVTYNGVSATLVPNSSGSSGNIESVQKWILVAPATGTNNIVVTMSGSISGRVTVQSASFYGADQTSPIVTSVVDDNEPLTADITTTVDNCMLVQLVANSSGFDISYTDGQTEINNQATGPVCYLAYKKVGVAGAYQMRVSFSGGSGNRVTSVSAIRPVNNVVSQQDTIISSEDISLIRSRIFEKIDTISTSESVEVGIDTSRWVNKDLPDSQDWVNKPLP